MGIPTFTTEKPSNSDTLPHEDLVSKDTATIASNTLHNSTTAPSQTTSAGITHTSTVGGPSSSTAPVSGAGTAHAHEGRQALSKEEADRLYEERMEDEYAKREGGA